MAEITTISPKELERQGLLLYDGRTVEGFLCLRTSEVLTASSLISEWEGIEVSGNGYSRVSILLPGGAYNTSSLAYEFPDIDLVFTCNGPSSISYNYLVVFLDGELYPHSIVQESPNLVLSPGRSQTYRISLSQTPY